jgi:hypothetical protein
MIPVPAGAERNIRSAGYDDMVIMSMGTYEKILCMNDVYNKLD